MVLPTDRVLRNVVALGCLIFVGDLLMPDGRALVVLYVIVIILSSKLETARSIVAVAAGCAAGTICSAILRHGIIMDPHYLARRGLVVAACGVAALLAIRNRSLERRRREKAELLDLTGDALFARDADDAITWWSQGASRLYGWSSQDVVGRCVDHLIYDGADETIAAARASIARDGHWIGEMRHRTRDGRLITVHSQWARHYDVDGRPLGTLESNTDVTQLRLADAHLAASEERFRRIFETSAAAIWEENYTEVLADLDAMRAAGVVDFAAHFEANPTIASQALGKVRVIGVNDTAVTLFQASSKAELLGALERVFIPEAIDSFVGLLVALAEGHHSYEAETRVRTLQGDRLAILMSVTFPTGLGPTAAALVSILDITQRREAEDVLRSVKEDLAQATHLATLGELTQSIAQEVEQPIAAATEHGLVALDAIKRAPQNQDDIVQAVGLVVREGRRAAAEVDRIRSIVRRSPRSGQVFDLADAIGNACRLMRREMLRLCISMRLDIEPYLPQVAGDRLQIEYVVLKLLRESIELFDLTDDARRDLVVTARLERDHARVTIWQSRIDPQVELTARLYEPLFAAHSEGNKPDLGLSVCRAAIEAHGGEIRVTTCPTGGVAVAFTLPLFTPTDDFACAPAGAGQQAQCPVCSGG